MKGGGNDTIYTTGNGITLVNEIIYIYVGNTYDARFGSGTDQENLDHVVAYIQQESFFEVIGTYEMKHAADNTLASAVPTSLPPLLAHLHSSVLRASPAAVVDDITDTNNSRSVTLRVF